jgi:hypothetical protein
VLDRVDAMTVITVRAMKVVALSESISGFLDQSLNLVFEVRRFGALWHAPPINIS